MCSLISYLILSATWTPTEIATLVGILSAAITGLLTFVTTKGVDAWLKVREDSRKDIAYEDKKMEEANRVLITRLEAQVANIETELKSVRSEHMDCVRNHAKLEGQLSAMASELDHLRQLVKTVPTQSPPVQQDFSIPNPQQPLAQ